MTIGTEGVGLNAAGNAVTYVPPRVIPVPRGATVTYGEWITSDAAAIGPGIYEMQSGSWQAANAGFTRTVTITPL